VPGGRLYRIILRGECGPLMAGVLHDVMVESGRGWTCVIALVHDDSELYGLLDRFQDFALRVVSLSELGTDVVLAGRRVAAGAPWPLRGSLGGMAAKRGRR
jgi:hypothetical protein